MDKNIPLSVPNLNGNELKYVSNAISSGWVSTAGPYVEEFEEKLAKYVNANGAVSCQNGTSGLHLALQAVGVKTGDLVFAPALTFIAAVNPIRYLNANPIFIDCDESLGIDPSSIEKFVMKYCTFDGIKLIYNKTSKVIKAIVVVHVFGNMASMPEILKIAKKYNLKIVEDATEALGTYYIDGPLKGLFAGTIGDIGVFSFNGNKIITTGGGGMVVSNNDVYLKKIRYLSTQAKDDALNFIHNEIGYNYRMTNIQAALGLAQLEQLEVFIETKKANYKKYNKLLSPKIGNLIKFRGNIRANYWFYTLLIKDTFKVIDLIRYLEQNDIQSRPIWSLINKQLPYQNEVSMPTPNAEMISKFGINIPCSSNLTEVDVNTVVKAINEYIK